MSIEYSTAENLIQIKQERNNCLIELLKIEEKMLQQNMYKNQLIINFNKKRIEEIHKINKIEDLQKKKYSLIRENEITMLTEQINLDYLDLSHMYKKTMEYKKKYIETLQKINLLNSKIPDKSTVTNVKFTVSNQEQTCHKANMGLK